MAKAGERISDEVVAERTGKTRDEWFALLDEWGGAERPHGEIARHLSEEHGVPGWWAQNVTVAYERARGLRDHGQKAAGYSANASKTVGVPVERLYAALIDERKRWAPDAPLTVRTATAPRSARFDWGDGTTRVNAWIEAKADDRSTLALEHERLQDAAEAERMRGFWRERLGHLKTLLEE